MQRQPGIKTAASIGWIGILTVACLLAWPGESFANPPEPVQPPALALEQSASATGIQVIDTKQLVELLQRQKGAPLLVNYWATWCPPCLEEMPALIEFFDQRLPEGTRFLSVSADHPDDVASRLEPYRQKTKLPFPVYVVGGEPPDRFIAAVDPEWQGSLPATFIHDASGAIIWRHFRETGEGRFR
jgi:thiol-disulfide isomerase/thioredoxin